MKAIIRFPKESSGTAVPRSNTYAQLSYLFSRRKSGAVRKVDDRVLWVTGDLGGHGVVEKDASTMAAALDCGHEFLRGRRTRHLVLSCEADIPEDNRQDTFGRLRDSVPLLATKLGATRWIAVAHDDTCHPHVHLLVANLDPAKGRRLDINPSLLRQLQTMDWTPYLESGKGSRKGPKSERGKRVRATGTARRKLMREREIAAARILQNLIVNRRMKISDVTTLSDWLETVGLPEGWSVRKLRTKRGKRRRDPVIVIDGHDLRLARLIGIANGQSKNKRAVAMRQSGPEM